MEGREISTPLERVDLAAEETRGRFFHSYRHAQLGRCVNGVMHDVNNYLGVIMAYAELAALDEGLGGEGRRMLGEVVEGANKCALLVSALMDVARKDKSHRAPVNVRDLVESALLVCAHDFRNSQIEVVREYSEDVPLVVASGPRVQMALLYMLLNAMEAAEGAVRKTVRVGVRSEDGQVQVSIWNSGGTLSGEDDEIFEPLTTDKGAPHLGCGLFLAREVGREHGGDVLYDAQRGFVISLPCDSPGTS